MDTVWEQWKMEGNMCECFQFQLQNPDFLIITDLDTLINFFYYHWNNPNVLKQFNYIFNLFHEPGIKKAESHCGIRTFILIYLFFMFPIYIVLKKERK